MGMRSPRTALAGWQYGVMYSDGSVARRWNGNTQEKHAREEAEKVVQQYPGENIRLVRRWVGNWEEVPKGQ
jgi:hypothetical protein